MAIRNPSDRHAPLFEFDDATSNCARMVHEEVTRRYAVPLAGSRPAGQARSRWTTRDAYRSAPGGGDLQPEPLVAPSRS